MSNHDSNTITLPRSVIKEGAGFVILPLQRWKKIEEALEDLEMYHSESLSKEISLRRGAKKAVPLEGILKKYHI